VLLSRLDNPEPRRSKYLCLASYLIPKEFL